MVSLAACSELCRDMTKAFFTDVLHFNYFKRNKWVEGLKILISFYPYVLPKAWLILTGVNQCVIRRLHSCDTQQLKR